MMKKEIEENGREVFMQPLDDQQDISPSETLLSSWTFVVSFYSRHCNTIHEVLDGRKALETLACSSEENMSKLFRCLEFSTVETERDTFYKTFPISLDSQRLLASESCERKFGKMPYYGKAQTVDESLLVKNQNDSNSPCETIPEELMPDKTFFNYAENRYTLSTLWMTPKDHQKRNIQLSPQRMEFFKPFNSRGKSSQFESFWSTPLGGIYSAASKRVLLEPTTMRDQLIRFFFFLRQKVSALNNTKRTTLTSSLDAKTAPETFVIEDSLPGEVLGEDTKEKDLNCFKSCSIKVLSESFSETMKPFNEGDAENQDKMELCSGVSTKVSVNDFKENIMSLENFLDQEKRFKQEGCSSAETNYEEEHDISNHIYPTSIDKEKSLPENCDPANKPVQNESFPFKLSLKPLNVSSPTVQKNPCFHHLLSNLSHADMRLLILAFERTDPYTVFSSHSSKLYKTLHAIGTLPRNSERSSDRFALLAKLIALKRMGQLIDIFSVDEERIFQHYIRKTLYQEGEIEHKAFKKNKLCILLTKDQLKLLKRPLYTIVSQFQAQHSAQDTTGSTLYVYGTRQMMKGQLPQERQYTCEPPSCVKVRNRSMARRRTSVPDTVSSTRRRRLVTSPKGTFPSTEKEDKDEKENESRVSMNNLELEPLSEPAPYYFSRRAGRPKVNRSGCHCLLCNTVQTPQWRFMSLFGDNWMDLVCNACYMKFNVSRPHLPRFRKPQTFPQLSNIKKPRRPTAEEYRVKGPCAFPHLMRCNISKQSVMINPYGNLSSDLQVEDEDDKGQVEDNPDKKSGHSCLNQLLQIDTIKCKSNTLNREIEFSEADDVLSISSSEKVEPSDKKDKHHETRNKTTQVIPPEMFLFHSRTSRNTSASSAPPEQNETQPLTCLFNKQTESVPTHSEQDEQQQQRQQSALYYYYYRMVLAASQWPCYEGLKSTRFPGILSSDLSPITFSDVAKTFSDLRILPNANPLEIDSTLAKTMWKKNNPDETRMDNSIFRGYTSTTHMCVQSTGNPGSSSTLKNANDKSSTSNYSQLNSSSQTLSHTTHERRLNGVAWGLPCPLLPTSGTVQLGEPVRSGPEQLPGKQSFPALKDME